MQNLTITETLVLNTIARRSLGNEITGAKVANAIGLKPRQTGKEGADLRGVINSLRRKGYPVCANGKGYYWPQSSTEILDYQATLQHRLERIQEAYDGIEHALKLTGLQPPLTLVKEIMENVREI